MHNVANEIRLGIRALARSPGFALVAILTLALGIGANTAIFSVVDGVLLRPLAVDGLDRLVVVRDDLPGLNLRSVEVSPAEAEDLAARADLFEASTAYHTPSFTLTGSGEPRRLSGVAALGDFFGVFGGRPQLGRLFRPEEAEAGRHRVVVLSHGLWQELAGGDPEIIGRTLELNDASYEVVGVMAPEFRYPTSAQLWAPFPMNDGMREPQSRGSLFMTAVSRLRPGITMERLAEQLRLEAQAWADRGPYPEHFGHTLVAERFVDFQAGPLRVVVLVLMGAVGLVLLIACANVASLQLVRAVGRSRDVAVRAALGAGRAAIMRPVLAESLLIAAAGGVLGLWMGDVVLSILARWEPAQAQLVRGLALDGRVLGFTAAITTLTGVLFGMYPALRAASADPQDALREAGRGHSGGVTRHRFLGATVMVQVALTVVLLAGTGVVVRSLGRLLDSDPGFRPERLLTFQVSAPGSRYANAESIITFYERLHERLGAIPGVQRVGTTSDLPFSDDRNSSPFSIEGRSLTDGEPQPHADMRQVSPDYFGTMGIQPIRGRLFAESDRFGSPLVVVIDEQLAREYFPAEDPIGRIIDQGRPAEIVGVVGSVRHAELGESHKATIYYSSSQFPVRRATTVLRTSLEPVAMVGTVRAAVAELDPLLPIFDVNTMEQRIERSLVPQRLAMTVLTGFAAFSLILSLLGIYGVTSYAMSQRTQELGIRVALGATPADVSRMVLGRAVSLVGLGTLAGVLVFLGIGRVLGALVYGVGARDPLALAAGAAAVLAIALFAAYLPARRAATVDPVRALRADA